MFWINAILVDLGIDVDIILDMAWMADLGNILWNFVSLEMWFQWEEHTITFASLLGR